RRRGSGSRSRGPGTCRARSSARPVSQECGQYIERIAVGAEPGDPRVTPEPSPLTAGEGARATCGGLEGLVERTLAGCVVQHFLVAQGLASGRRHAWFEGDRLIDEPLLDLAAQ